MNKDADCFSALQSDRDPVDEIPAVYFIMPTKENISRIRKVKIHKLDLSDIYLKRIGFT